MTLRENLTAPSHAGDWTYIESSQLVEKVAYLERKLTENELTMDKMKKEMEVLQNVWFVAFVTWIMSIPVLAMQLLFMMGLGVTDLHLRHKHQLHMIHRTYIKKVVVIAHTHLLIII